MQDVVSENKIYKMLDHKMHSFLHPPKYGNQNNYQQHYIDHNTQNKHL